MNSRERTGPSCRPAKSAQSDMAKILFLHGWTSVPGGVKPTYLKDHGHSVLNPSLPDEDFSAAVRIAQSEFDKHQPRVVVGSSRGGAVAMNIKSADAKLILLCPAWKKYGTARTVKPGTVILHSRADDVIEFVDSEELVRNSGLPATALIEVGNDHRLADPEPLQRMLGFIELTIPTLCIGIDVTWWGGSPRRRDSQRDTIVYTLVQAGAAPELQFSFVDLSVLPNPRPSPTEPNFDADGELLTSRVAEILADNKGRFLRCVVALDAPLEARIRANQPRRMKAADAGTETGAKRRQCEEMIQQHRGTSNSKQAQAWHSDLRIQSGSPVAPRIASVVEKLKTNCGMACWGMDRSSHERQVIEIFPSEAIWSLGLMGGFANLSPSDIRSYKTKKPSSLLREFAEKTALRPLLGFAECFEAQISLPLRRWSEQIADYACAIATDKRDGGTVRKGKGFDDPIESGIAFLTAVSFVGGVYHAWGDGTDGTIVGPGQLQVMSRKK